MCMAAALLVHAQSQGLLSACVCGCAPSPRHATERNGPVLRINPSTDAMPPFPLKALYNQDLAANTKRPALSASPREHANTGVPRS